MNNTTQPEPASDLKSLTSSEAAWLIGETPERLAAWSDAPREPDGTFNGQRLVSWYRRHVGFGEPLVFCREEHDHLVAAVLSSIPEGQWHELHEALNTIKERYGDAGLLAYARLLYWLSGPDADWTHRSVGGGPTDKRVMQRLEQMFQHSQTKLLKIFAEAPDILTALVKGEAEADHHRLFTAWAEGAMELMGLAANDQAGETGGEWSPQN